MFDLSHDTIKISLALIIGGTIAWLIILPEWKSKPPHTKTRASLIVLFLIVICVIIARIML